MAPHVVSSIVIPSADLRSAVWNSGSPGDKISENPGATRLDLDVHNQILNFLVKSLQLGEMFDVVDGEENPIADHLCFARRTALATQRPSQKFHNKTQSVSLVGDNPAHRENRARRVRLKRPRMRRRVALAINDPSFGYFLSSIYGNSNFSPPPQPRWSCQ